MCNEVLGDNGGARGKKNGGEDEEGTNERVREQKCIKQSKLAAGDSGGTPGRAVERVDWQVWMS